MSADEPDEWQVVINGEEQYALLPALLPVPAGWREAGFVGDRSACAAYVDERWDDIRPRSSRRTAESAGGTHR